MTRPVRLFPVVALAALLVAFSAKAIPPGLDWAAETVQSATGETAIQHCAVAALPDGEIWSLVHEDPKRNPAFTGERTRLLLVKWRNGTVTTEELDSLLPVEEGGNFFNQSLHLEFGGGRLWAVYNKVTEEDGFHIRLRQLHPEVRPSVKIPRHVFSNYVDSYALCVTDEGRPLVARGGFGLVELVRYNGDGSFENARVRMFDNQDPGNPPFSVSADIAVRGSALYLVSSLTHTRNPGGPGFETSRLILKAGNLTEDLTDFATTLNESLAINQYTPGTSANRRRFGPRISLDVSEDGSFAVLYGDEFTDDTKVARSLPGGNTEVVVINSSTSFWTDTAFGRANGCYLVESGSDGVVTLHYSASPGSGFEQVRTFSPVDRPSFSVLTVQRDNHPVFGTAFGGYSDGDSGYVLNVPTDILDEDNDGVIKLVENALLSDDTSAASRPSISFLTVEDGPERFPGISYTRPLPERPQDDNPAVAGGIVYTVQRSTDMVEWTSQGVVQYNDFSFLNREVVFLRSPESFRDEPRQFLRIVVERP